MDNDSDAGQAYLDAVERFLGEDKPLRYIEAKKVSLFQRIFKGARA